MAIADALLPLDVSRVLSSRYVRCTQTVGPLADKLGLEVETHPALAEEGSFKDAWALVEDAAASGRETVLCSHGNILSPILDRLRRRGIEVVADEWSCHTGSVWSVEVAEGEITRAVQTLAKA